MLLDDLKTITESVHGSGLPDSLFDKNSPVYAQIQSVGGLLDITPRQTVMLAVAFAVHDNITMQSMAEYCGCQLKKIFNFHWDLMTLCIKGCLNVDATKEQYVYNLPFGIESYWSNNKVYSTMICYPDQVKVNRLFVDKVFNDILRPILVEGKPIPAGGVRNTVEEYIRREQYAKIIEHFRIVCDKTFCMCPSLTIVILVITTAIMVHNDEVFANHTLCEFCKSWLKRKYNDQIFAKLTLQELLFGTSLSDYSEVELFCALDYLHGTGLIDWNSETIRLSGSFLERWIAADLDMDLKQYSR